jgi:EAL domain-containing protein (putative c-di-GMP-specific phosphodiesterase class I)
LCLEITEDNAVLNFDSLNRQIAELKKSGVQFSLDDFGTGHSSLEYVRQLKVDHLKVDRCFVEGIENSNDNLRFLGSIIAMANMAYMTPVIEGVENQAQWDLLPDKANVLVQGYFIARPMVFNDFMGFLMDPAAHYPTARQVETAVS